MKEYIKKSELVDYIDELSDDKLISMWNTYCREEDSDNEIYYNEEEFFETFFSDKVIEAVRAISYGEYNYSDKYVKFDGYANLESFNNPEDHIDKQELISYIEENPEEFDIEFDEEDDEKLTNYVDTTYDMIKYTWKKSPSKYGIYKTQEEEQNFYYFTNNNPKDVNDKYMGNLKLLHDKL